MSPCFRVDTQEEECLEVSDQNEAIDPDPLKYLIVIGTLILSPAMP